jgi:hypothetical protein
MRLTTLFLASATLLACAATPIEAGTWTLGSNLGLTVLSPEEGDNVTYVALPGTVAGLQPGLRVGFPFESGHEWYLDTGLLITTSEGFSSRSFGVTANYQFNFGRGAEPPTRLSPYLTAGLGFLYTGREVGSQDASAASATFGGGVGLRRAIGNDTVVLRGELRYDRFTKAEDAGVVLVPDGNAFGVKLGFDVRLGSVS